MLSRMTSDFQPLFRLQNEMNQLFESFFEDVPATRPYGAAYPGVNVWEDGENTFLEAELPGLTLNDVEVLVRGNEVTLNGERKIGDGHGVSEASWHRRERSQGRFTRTLTLPWEIDAEHVEAKLQDGVLTVRLPKSESAKARKVKILS